MKHSMTIIVWKIVLKIKLPDPESNPGLISNTISKNELKQSIIVCIREIGGAVVYSVEKTMWLSGGGGFFCQIYYFFSQFHY